MSNEILKGYQQKLDTMRPFITEDDRRQILDKGIVSRPTLNAYLSGDVTRVSTAHLLVSYFEPIITKRIRQYNKSNAA